MTKTASNPTDTQPAGAFGATGGGRIGPMSFVIEHHVQPGKTADYEAWLKRIVPVCKSFPGHLGVQVNRPAAGQAAYTIVVRFDSSDALDAWMKSDERAGLIAEAQPILVDGDRFTVVSGLDFWFTPESAKAKLPTRWKQALVTWSAIFPLVMLVPLALRPLFVLGGPFEWHAFKTLIVTGVIVALMVYTIMPRYTKLVHRWLFR